MTQALGTCEECGHFCAGGTGRADKCRRQPPNFHYAGFPITTRSQWCGEWTAIVMEDKEHTKSLIPPEVLEGAPWLLEPIPFKQALKYAHKERWTYAYHLVRQRRDQDLLGDTLALKQSTVLMFLNMPEKKKLRYEDSHIIAERCEWLINNQATVLPSLFE